MSEQPFTESWLTGPKSTNFYTRTYAPPSGTPPKAVVVFLHGFAEHIGRYTHFHPRFPENGIVLFAFDQRGYGLTAQDTGGNKSKGSAYGKTSWIEHMGDTSWAIEHVRKEFPDIPVFLMGHSMGGGETLSFVSRGETSPQHATATSLQGVIATSPLILQAHPTSKLLRCLGALASVFAPNVLIPADVNAKFLSHDESRNEAYLKDPLIKQQGSLRGINDMLSYGELLLHKHYKFWPVDLPLLIVHGTADQVTSHKASQAFYDKVPAQTKKIHLVEGGYHELQNEPQEVQDTLANEVISFINAQVSQSAETVVVSAEGVGSTGEAEVANVESVDTNQVGKDKKAKL